MRKYTAWNARLGRVERTKRSPRNRSPLDPRLGPGEVGGARAKVSRARGRRGMLVLGNIRHGELDDEWCVLRTRAIAPARPNVVAQATRGSRHRQLVAVEPDRDASREHRHKGVALQHARRCQFDLWKGWRCRRNAKRHAARLLPLLPQARPKLSQQRPECRKFMEMTWDGTSFDSVRKQRQHLIPDSVMPSRTGAAWQHQLRTEKRFACGR